MQTMRNSHMGLDHEAGLQLQRNTFHGLSWAAFKGWWAYVKLALPCE